MLEMLHWPEAAPVAAKRVYTRRDSLNYHDLWGYWGCGLYMVKRSERTPGSKYLSSRK